MCWCPGSNHQQVCVSPSATIKKKKKKQGSGPALKVLSIKRVISSWDRILGFSNRKHPLKLLNVLVLEECQSSQALVQLSA